MATYKILTCLFSFFYIDLLLMFHHVPPYWHTLWKREHHLRDCCCQPRTRAPNFKTHSPSNLTWNNPCPPGPFNGPYLPLPAFTAAPPGPSNGPYLPFPAFPAAPTWPRSWNSGHATPGMATECVERWSVPEASNDLWPSLPTLDSSTRSPIWITIASKTEFTRRRQSSLLHLHFLPSLFIE